MPNPVDFPPDISPAPSPAPRSAKARDPAPDPAPARSGLGDIDDPRRPVLAALAGLSAGYAVTDHSHPRAQLLLCRGGLIRLQVGTDAWVVPVHHGVWIPAGMSHALCAMTQVELCNVFVDPGFAGRTGLPDGPMVLRVTPLLRVVTARLAEGRLDGAEARRLAWVALDEMARLEQTDLRLPGGQDPRLVRAMARMLTDYGIRQGIEGLAHATGVSSRTLARLFQTETGLVFRDWRARLRFVVALERLEQGETSSTIATALGYSTPSAFSSAFSRHFGAPPSAFRGGPGRAARRRRAL